MAQIKYIKDLYENEEASLREICRITGHSFETVRKYAYQENWSEDNLPDIEPQSYPVLQDFIPIIDKWLEEDRKAPRKQRHNELCEFGNKDSCGKALPYRNGKSQSVRGEIWREPEHTAKMAVKL